MASGPKDTGRAHDNPTAEPFHELASVSSDLSGKAEDSRPGGCGQTGSYPFGGGANADSDAGRAIAQRSLIPTRAVACRLVCFPCPRTR